jgi:hypothetical protein
MRLDLVVHVIFSFSHAAKRLGRFLVCSVLRRRGHEHQCDSAVIHSSVYDMFRIPRYQRTVFFQARHFILLSNRVSKSTPGRHAKMTGKTTRKTRAGNESNRMIVSPSQQTTTGTSSPVAHARVDNHSLLKLRLRWLSLSLVRSIQSHWVVSPV